MAVVQEISCSFGTVRIHDDLYCDAAPAELEMRAQAMLAVSRRILLHYASRQCSAPKESLSGPKIL